MDTAEMLVKSALRRGRCVSRFESMPKTVPFVPVPDTGIDIKRGRSNGIKGYEAEAARRRRIKEYNIRIMAEALEEVAKKAKQIPEHVETGAIRPSIRVIQWHVCSFSHTLRNDLLSSRRTKEVIKPRHIGMMLAKMLTLRSLPEIGKEFGSRDHTTVLHAIRKTEKLQEWLLQRRNIGDSIELWVSDAFEGWDKVGLQ